ncbi:hypothetical protein DAPPUDRAFT_261661 [Daphnia pulex]|uniref:Uncharacterized protein n=1 Tax=Daphnia pulex TaxID=6669 RepID=E9HLE5_DAPPU|nr:hypothetical protein DAPPUDRAFT_261661 [Daphnia pulex]|eukprot:EFX67423.1 hypothetical protein DAPPUDRAFT_261661 [Daphnia pulex]
MVKREEFGKFCRIDNTISALCRFGKSNSANPFFFRIDQLPPLPSHPVTLTQRSTSIPGPPALLNGKQLKPATNNNE